MKLLSSGIIFAACTLSLPAASLTWDTDSGTTGAQGGAGTWTDGGSGWWNGTANVAWNNATPDNATFGGAAGGTVTLGSAITAGSIGFDTAGYTLGAGTINLGSGFTVTTNAAATIGSVMASTTNGLAKSGTGTLTVTGSNTYRGATVVNAGTLVIAPGAKLYSGYNQNFSGFLTVNAGGTVEFSNPDYGGSFGETWASSSISVNGGTMRYVGAAATWKNNAIRFGAAGGTIDASGSGLLTISGMANYNQTAGSTVTLAGSGAGSFGHILSGTGGVIKSGNGTWTLAADNTFSGTTVVNGGRLIVSSTLRNSATMTANNGSTLEMGFTNILVGGHGTAVEASRVITANASTILFNGSMDSRIGNITLNNGSTLTSNRSLSAWDVLLANTTAGAATVSVTGSGKSTMNGSGGIHLQGPQNFNVADTVPGTGADLEVTTRLDNGGNGGGVGAVVKQGGGTMLFTGQMTYTGGTTVNAGVLAVDGNQAANRLTNNHAVTVNNSGTFEVRGVNALPNGGNSVDFTVNAGGTLNIVSGGSAAIGAGGTSHAHVRNLTLNGGSVAMAYSGAGDAYNGESFQLNGTVTVGGSVASTISSSTTTGLSGLALAGNRTFDVGNVTGTSASDLIVNAELENTDFTPADDGFTKTGAGTMELAAGVTHSYTGATAVSAGTLLVNGTLGDTAVTVGASGTLGGTGTLGGSLAFDAGAKLDLTGATLGLNSTDILSVAAGKAITLTDFAFSNIIGWTAASADQGTYELIKGGGIVTFNGSTPTVSNMFDFGNGKLGYFEQGSLRAVIVPESSIALLGGLGALGLLRRRRQS
ncbi:MAG: autotransporter-associated beta strand repeat-containing protein [Verrucomicrobia bacterium]|nr:autotransporter-associated beta strand repeat-containing protein [Verrucomicrobiota bacterium]